MKYANFNFLDGLRSILRETLNVSQKAKLKLQLVRTVLILIIPLLVISCSQKKIMIIADEWPQMDALAARLDEYGDYYIQKAGQDEIDFDLSEFDFIFMYVHKPIVPDGEKAFIDFTNGGGSLIVLHHGIASSKMQTDQGCNPLLVGIKNQERAGFFTTRQVIQ